MRSPQKISPHFHLVKIDETEHFDSTDGGKELIRLSGGRIYGVYLYDENQVTYLCSSEKNYFLHYIEHVPETWPENEEEFENLSEIIFSLKNECSHGDYYQTSRIDQISCQSKIDLGLGDPIWTDDEESYRDCFEEMLEHVQGNSYF